jgi:hypothetical protein
MPDASRQSWKKLAAEYRKADIALPKLKAITLAQWALESGRGTSELSQKHLNFAGLKFRERMQGHATPVDYEASDGLDTYCAFASIADFIRGYWHFIDSGPYQGYRDFADDPVGYVAHLKSKGYAGDPTYVQKVVRLLAEAQELLEEEPAGGEPDRPSRPVLGDYAPPEFIRLSDISHRVIGRRPRGLEGAIVHYDAYRIRRAGNGPEDPERRTVDMMRSGQQNGFHYAEISRAGKIYLCKNFDWLEWGYHAGESKCPLTGREGVSQFYVGFEMNNPGILYEAQEDQEDGVFCPWYNSRLTERGRVILDGRGRCHRVSANDEWYRRDEVRYAQGDNITPGWYLPYSYDQFEALVNAMGYLLGEFPNTFSLDKVFGHDEVSPRRKQDPGGALAHPGQLMPMREFRAYLKEKF